jgi:hypothetical protein
MKRLTYPILFLLIGGGELFAQTPPVMPPKTIQVIQPTVSLSFGNFTAPVFSNGKVTVTETGVRTAEGDVFLMGGNVQPGIFEFYLLPGRLVTVTYPVQVYVDGMGPNGGRLLVDNFSFMVEGVPINSEVRVIFVFAPGRAVIFCIGCMWVDNCMWARFHRIRPAPTIRRWS